MSGRFFTLAMQNDANSGAQYHRDANGNLIALTRDSSAGDSGTTCASG
jgi:hypothetical protein